MFWVFVFFVACSNTNEKELLLSESTWNNVDDILYENGMIVLKNGQVLNDILKNERSIQVTSFISQQDIMKQLVEAERLHAISLRDLSDYEYDIVDKHSSLYMKLLNEEFIKIEKYSDGTELYTINLALPNYAKVLNKDGYFAIQDTIYQITSDKMIIWLKGNEKKNNTDSIRKICEFDYSRGNILTKALPVINKSDQKIAYCSYNWTSTGRPILSFYDITSLNIPQQGFNRDVFVRYSYQEKLDGRNFVFAEAPYGIYLGLQFFNSDVMEFTVNGTGSDDWYTVYFDYQFLNPGKDTQLITEANKYYDIKNVFMKNETYLGIDNKHIYFTFEGERRDDNIFYYHSSTGGQIFTPLLPE